MNRWCRDLGSATEGHDLPDGRAMASRNVCQNHLMRKATPESDRCHRDRPLVVEPASIGDRLFGERPGVSRSPMLTPKLIDITDGVEVHEATANVRVYKSCALRQGLHGT